MYADRSDGPGDIKKVKYVKVIPKKEKLSKKLSENDPLLNRIKLSKTQYLFCCILGGIKGLVLGTKFG